MCRSCDRSHAIELANEFPSHVAAAWLGHTEAIANAHYRQVTDDHFASAVKASNTSKHPDERVSANPTRNPTQHIAETGCNDKNSSFRSNENRTAFPSDSSHCLSLQSKSMGPSRFELPTSSLSGTRSNQLSYEPAIRDCESSNIARRQWMSNRCTYGSGSV